MLPGKVVPGLREPGVVPTVSGMCGRGFMRTKLDVLGSQPWADSVH